MTTSKPTLRRPVFCQATGAPVFVFLKVSLKPEGAERRQAHQQFHACEARRASCAVDKFTQSAQTSTRHARLSALHRGDFGRRDCSNHHPDRPFGLLIPQAFACIRPGANCQLWRALVVGPGSTPRLPEMACETIRRRRTRSANQDASRWRPRMSRQQHDTELLEEKSLHARRYARISARACFYSEKPVHSAGITAPVAEKAKRAVMPQSPARHDDGETATPANYGACIPCAFMTAPRRASSNAG